MIIQAIRNAGRWFYSQISQHPIRSFFITVALCVIGYYLVLPLLGGTLLALGVMTAVACVLGPMLGGFFGWIRPTPPQPLPHHAQIIVHPLPPPPPPQHPRAHVPNAGPAQEEKIFDEKHAETLETTSNATIAKLMEILESKEVKDTAHPLNHFAKEGKDVIQYILKGYLRISNITEQQYLAEQKRLHASNTHDFVCNLAAEDNSDYLFYALQKLPNNEYLLDTLAAGLERAIRNKHKDTTDMLITHLRKHIDNNDPAVARLLDDLFLKIIKDKNSEMFAWIIKKYPELIQLRDVLTGDENLSLRNYIRLHTHNHPSHARFMQIYQDHNPEPAQEEPRAAPPSPG